MPPVEVQIPSKRSGAAAAVENLSFVARERAALTLATCGVGSVGAESKISDTTDTYLRSLSSGDTTKACAQPTDEAQMKHGTSCMAAMERIAATVVRERPAEAADKAFAMSVDGSRGSATLKGLNDVRIGVVESGSNWLIESAYESDGAP